MIEFFNEDKDFECFSTKLAVLCSSIIYNFEYKLIRVIFLFHFSKFRSIFNIFETFLIVI